LVLQNPDGTSVTNPTPITIEAATSLQVTLNSGGTRTPRAGGRWDVPCTLVNNGNVDVPYVTIFVGYGGHVSMGWARPADSLPRQSDYPGVDWLNASPTATFRDGVTEDAFWLRDVEAGQSVSFVWRVPQVGGGWFQFNISARA